MNKTLRMMSYNVHSCVGTDRKRNLARITDVIREQQPDVVALQELDQGRARSGGLDQAMLIAEKLSMYFHFQPAFRVKEEQYGDAILSRFPMQIRHAGTLPTVRSFLAFEPRGALWVSLTKDDVAVNIINTHLGLSPKERDRQVEALLGPSWLDNPECAHKTILCGDLNALPSSRVYRKLFKRMRDTHAHLPGKGRTFPSWYPLLRLDYIFVSPDLETVSSEIVRTPLARIASDHLPILTDIRLTHRQRPLEAVAYSHLGAENAACMAENLF